MTSLVISFHASMIQLAITCCGCGFKFPARVSWLIPSSASHLLYFSVAKALNGLFQLTSGACMYFVYREKYLYEFSKHERKIPRFTSCDIHKNPKMSTANRK